MSHSLSNVRVENYQSIGEADLPLGDLTVIVGRGNLGKSALIRAISAALFNETGADFIRKGTKTCRVTLTFPPIETVTWIKDEKSARYEADVEGIPVKFTKLAGGVPVELVDLFGVRVIQVDSTFSICPQVHGQHDPPILLQESSGKAARALAKLTKLETVVKAQVAAAKDLRRAKQDITARTREAKELEDRFEQFPNLTLIDNRLESAEHLINQADERLTALGQAEEAYDVLVDVRRRLKKKPRSVAEFSVMLERLDEMLVKVRAVQNTHTTKTKTKIVELEVPKSQMETVRAEMALEEFLASLGVCPVCGQEITEGHDDA